MAFRALEILDLLEIYQGVISTRPLEMGNVEFLQCLLSAASKLGDALAEAPRHTAVRAADIQGLRALLLEQSPANAKKLAVRALRLISKIRTQCSLRQGSPPLYLRGSLARLPRNSSRVTVMFGPALGLGDQITFLPFLKQLARHCRGSSMTIFTLYPNLWTRLLPGCKEFSYRDRPLRPFTYLETIPAMGKRDRELVVIGDFECFNLHRKIVPRRAGRDILEIALGRRAAWLNQDGSPWIRFKDFFSPSIVNNYWILGSIARELFGGAGSLRPWESVGGPAPARRPQREKVILLNPFTSKNFSLKPKDWHRVLQRIRAMLSMDVRLKVLVYPGLHSSTVEYTAEVCRLSAKGNTAMTVSPLAGRNGKALTAHSALPTLAQALCRVDLCVTVDTFASHFVPLFRIPTIVITHRDNREFWVPSSWNFYCLLDRMERTIPYLTVQVLRALVAPESNHDELGTSARALVRLTRRASEQGLTLSAIQGIQKSTAEALRLIETGFPFREQGTRWLLLWSRLAYAQQQEPVDPAILQPYLFQWKECEFFKLLLLRTGPEDV